MFVACASPRPCLALSPVGLVLKKLGVRKAALMQRIHLLMGNPSGPDHRFVKGNFDRGFPVWGVAVSQFHISKTCVYPPAGEILACPGALPLKLSRLSMGHMSALHMHHVTVKGFRLPGDQKLASLGWASIPRGHGGMEGIPMC